MKLASLYSGGKDSTFSLFLARQAGHEISCLITMHPAADDSPLFHYQNSWITKHLAEAMQIPLVDFSVTGSSKELEMAALEQAILRAKSLYSIEGIVHGGISSNYQKQAFEEICRRNNLNVIAPLWNSSPVTYMNELIDRGFKIIIVAVSAMGLEKEWLGAVLDKDSLAKLESLSKKYGFNLAFEGGEAETLVIDCPMFKKRLDIRRAKARWDGQRGIFEIQEVALVEK